ncbi:hypothetical protein C2G38_2158603 [Gigaspora rosea]|uniref:Uncharacterized protein n=1 Tax=Gigaspora rosea TaxID=44941 RepID=A0A397W792_9GLOM|nr:hypothetical protein C2G38_2158603 [Gigaspora rosea]
MSLRNEDISRDNFCIICELRVPMQNKKVKKLVVKQFFGRVLRYFVYEYNDASLMLAYIKWANVSNENNYRFGLKKFHYFGHKNFIDVKAIKSCIGFLKSVMNIIY